jgi:hypothetical protein
MLQTVEIRNRGVLFAHAYLDSCLAKLQKTKQLYLLETAIEWFAKADKTSFGSFADTFIGPMLDVLGHVRGELQGNIIALYEDRSRKKLVSLCYAVNFDESLDQTLKGRNYPVVLVKELKKAGVNWGILTNGNLWRLYCVKEKAPFETYFQVNLNEVLRTSDSLEMSLFADFFGAQALLLDEKGKCRLNVNRQESEDATRQIEEHLKGKMEDILGKICMGFIQSEGKKSYTEEEKNAVFNNSIYLLYRILFILYAEARGFLPLQNPEYYEKSIAKLMSIGKENHCRGIQDPNGRQMWNTLREVINWINNGNRLLEIPPYNGGLFDDNENSYLENHMINDAYLSEALFSLGFREKRGDIIPIDYNDLSVRNLGGIYEGILEYKLFITPERMVRRKEKNVFKFVPESEAGKITIADIVIEKGDVYFSQSSEERKMTGSYYTPEDVVQYIVENALGPYLIDVNKEFQATLQKLIEAREVAIDNKERRGVEKFIDKEIQSYLENKILSTKVLDPAMGSGHFLVNASFFLANHIVKCLYSTEWENDSIDTSPLLWRRKVVEKCIFGVDKNKLATELAKLSLWLITTDNKKPLTFLDHHLRTGNSLIGTDLNDLKTLPWSNKTTDSKYPTLFSYPSFREEFIPKVLSAFSEMEASSEDLFDIDRKKGKLKEIENLRKGLKCIADTWLATFFGHRIGEKDYQSKLTGALQGEDVQVDSEVEKIACSPDIKFFHWWLEFPEAFLKPAKTNSALGFDIIIGNPPYGNILKDAEKRALLYFETKDVNEIAANFVEKSLKIVRKDGYLSFILANSIAINERTAPVRQLIRKQMSTSRMALFGTRPARIFTDAEIRVLIFFGKADKPEQPGVIMTTEAIKFISAQRDSILENLSFESTEGLTLGNRKIGDGLADISLPKVGNSIIRNILMKLKTRSNIVIKDRINRPTFKERMEFRKTGGYWLNALETIPYKSSKIEIVRFETSIERDYCILLVNSSLFYLYWSTYGNLRDAPLSLMEKFPFPAVNELTENQHQIATLRSEISECLLKSFVAERGRVGEFRTALCKHVIDQLDDFLGGIYGLTKEEIEFVKKYDCHIRKGNLSEILNEEREE